MKTTVQTLEPTKVKLVVEVPPERVKKAMDKAARELAQHVNLPGFRKGKVPRKMLEQRIGEGSIAQQAMEDSISGYYIKALEAAEIYPVAQPEVDVQTFDEKEGCRFEATVEVRPDFELPDHTGIGVTYPDWDVADDDVEAELQQLRERFAEVDEVDREAEFGDYTTIDLTVTVDGEQVTEIEDALYEIGSAGVTPKLDYELTGTVAGSELTYTDTLPDDYPEHGGEEAEFAVTVKDVRAKTLPELDDDFAMTASEFDTLEELRKDIRDNLLRRSVSQARNEVRNRVVEAYLATVDIPLPQTMIDNEKQARLDRITQQAEQMGMTLEEVYEQEETTEAEVEENAVRAATQAVKAQLVLDKLAEKLELEVEAQDIDLEVIRLAQQYGMPPEQIAQQIQQQGSIGALVGDALRRKTIGALMDAADVDGAPSDEVLIELGFKQDPDAEDEAEAEVVAEGDTGIILPGGEDTADAVESELIVPGQD